MLHNYLVGKLNKENRKISISFHHKQIIYDFDVNYRPAFLTNPASASMSSQISQRKHSGCQFPFIALMTRPMIYSPQPLQHGA